MEPVGAALAELADAVAATGEDVVSEGVLDAGKQGVPGRGSRGRHEGSSVLAELPHPFEVVVRFVPPVDEEEILRQKGKNLRMLEDEVGPDHRLLAVLRRELLDPRDVRGEDGGGTFRLRPALRKALSQVNRLVAVGVEPG